MALSAGGNGVLLNRLSLITTDPRWSIREDDFFNLGLPGAMNEGPAMEGTGRGGGYLETTASQLRLLALGGAEAAPLRCQGEALNALMAVGFSHGARGATASP